MLIRFLDKIAFATRGGNDRAACQQPAAQKKGAQVVANHGGHINC